jgi:hypothetical protein
MNRRTDAEAEMGERGFGYLLVLILISLSKGFACLEIHLALRFKTYGMRKKEAGVIVAANQRPQRSNNSFTAAVNSSY